MIIGIMGLAGAGKDTVGDLLAVNHGFAKIAFADPMKRAVAEWFGWDEERLWGPSAARNEPDPRFGGLTARKALQFLGTEIGRELYPDVWAEIGIATARSLLAVPDDAKCVRRYDRARGIVSVPSLYSEAFLRSSGNDGCVVGGVAITDVRFRNEVDAIRRAGGYVVRVVRSGAGLKGAAAAHRSEVEQAGIADGELDAVLENSGTLADLAAAAAKLVSRFGKKDAVECPF